MEDDLLQVACYSPLRVPEGSRRDIAEAIDTNPWKVFPRFITSMDYLRLPDVLQVPAGIAGRPAASLRDVRIRRLKDGINAHSLHRPFAEQHDPESLAVNLSADEIELFAALREYRTKGEATLKDADGKERWLGKFIDSMLTKRLLSCPFAFARTWWRHVEPDEELSADQNLFQLAEVSAQRAADQVRLLLATDAASEGINMQQECRWVSTTTSPGRRPS